MRSPSQGLSSSSASSRISTIMISSAVALIAIIWGSTMLHQSCTSDASTSLPTYCQYLGNYQQKTIDTVQTNVHDTKEGKAPKRKKIRQFFKKLFQRRKKSELSLSTSAIEYPFATTDPNTKLSKSAIAIVTRLDQAVRQETDANMSSDKNSFDARVAAVFWGGPGGTPWYTSRTLEAYLRIMKWPTEKDWSVTFPLKLCQNKCSPTFAVLHTLEWREKYKPWCVAPSTVKENNKGWAYHRGFSPNNGHALVWTRFAIHRTVDTVQWVRVMIYTLEHAVADSLKRTSGKSGRFNAVVDGNGFSLSLLLGMGHIKRMVVMLQDHFPDRLGVVLLANFAKPAQIMLSFVKPLLTKEVRDKMYILPDDPEKRKAMLDALIGEENVPYYLGGSDEYRFDAQEYYSSPKHRCTEAESTEYLKTMPYHA